MSISSRFAVAVHLLALLHLNAGEPATSEWMASSVSTNPSVVRRILSMLARAGLTTSRLGTGGGALLARPGEGITLRDVYRAVEGGELFSLHHEPPSGDCPVGRNIQSVLEEMTTSAQRAMEDALHRRTIAEVAGEVLEHERGHAPS